MSTNKKTVVWNLGEFLRPDLTKKVTYHLAKNFFNWEKEVLGQNIYPCIYRLKFGIQRHRRFQHLAKPIDSRKFEVGQKRYGYAQLMRYASPNNHKWKMVSFMDRAKNSKKWKKSAEGFLSTSKQKKAVGSNIGNLVGRFGYM